MPDFIRQFRATIAFAGVALQEPEAENDSVGEDEGAASSGVKPPKPADLKPRVDIKRPPLKAGMTQAVFPLDEGEVVLQMPDRFSQESFEDFEAWLDLVLKKAKRSITTPEKNEPA